MPGSTYMGSVSTEARQSEDRIAGLQVCDIRTAFQNPARKFETGGDGPTHKFFSRFVKPQTDKHVGKIYTGGRNFHQHLLRLGCRPGAFLYLKPAVAAGPFNHNFFHYFFLRILKLVLYGCLQCWRIIRLKGSGIMKRPHERNEPARVLRKIVR